MRICVLFALVLCLAATRPASKAEAIEEPHPEAPEQMSQLAFLIGSWEMDTWFAQPDGTRREGSASMIVRYTLDGFGVELQDRYPTPGGRPDFVSTTTYVFNPTLAKWVGSGINTLGNRKSYEASFESGEWVTIQSGMLFGGRPGINRLTCFDISESGFELILEHSPDDGKTWEESAFGYTARRVK